MKNIIFDICGVLFNYSSTGIVGQDLRTVFEPIKKGHELVQECAKNEIMSVRLFILSNSGNTFFNLLNNHYPGFFSIFHGIVLSESAGFKKPDRRIYEYIVNKYDLVTQDCLMIDDKDLNVQAAKDVGMSGILFTEFDPVEKDILKFIKG